MNVIFYKNASPDIQVQKVLQQTGQVDAKFKGDVNVEEPTLILQSSLPLSSNYFYIPNLHRYYYLDKIKTLTTGIIEITGAEDYLFSHMAEIKDSYGIIKRNENNYNTYINDLQFTAVNYTRIQTKVFPTQFNQEPTFVLTVLGG